MPEPTSAVVEAPVRPKRVPKRINVALAATILTANPTLTYDEVAPKVGAKNGATLRSKLHQNKVTRRLVSELHSTVPVNGNTITCIVKQASDALKEMSAHAKATLGTAIVKQAETVAKRKVPRGLDGQNKHADTTLKLVKSGAGVFGWDEQRTAALVVAGVLTGAIGEVEDQDPAIDVESTPKPGA